MRALLALAAMTVAAAATPTSPALAADRGFTGPSIDAGHGRGFDRDFRHRRLRGTDTVIVYDRDYQGDTAWRRNSFNDWWHERTERSYPRWLQNNANCERKWWAGETLRC